MKPVFVLVVLCLSVLGIPGCGDSGGGCPGIICSNCAQADCDIECSGDEQETCVGLQFFGQDNPNDLRCAFCD